MNEYGRISFGYIVIASDRRERGNLAVTYEIASSLSLLAMT